MQVWSWVGKISLRRKARQLTPVFLPGGSRGQRWATGNGVTKGQTWLKWLRVHAQPIDSVVVLSGQQWRDSATYIHVSHSSTLAWKIPWTEEPGGLQSMGSLRVVHDWVTSLSLFTFMHWRRKWQPLQCSCLENPRDGGAWWAAVYGVAQSQTQLKVT